MKIYSPLCQTYSPTVDLKSIYKNQHTWSKWLIHDTKRREDNQLQSMKLPCRMFLLSI